MEQLRDTNLDRNPIAARGRDRVTGYVCTCDEDNKETFESCVKHGYVWLGPDESLEDLLAEAIPESALGVPAVEVPLQTTSWMLEGLGIACREVLPDVTDGGGRQAPFGFLGSFDSPYQEVIDEIRSKMVGDIALLNASRRWNRGRPQPVEYVAGDSPFIRMLHIYTEFNQLYHERRLEWNEMHRAKGVEYEARRALRDSWLSASAAFELYNAPLYYLPAQLVVDIMDSDAPPFELGDDKPTFSLPFRSAALIFGADMELDEDDLRGVLAQMDRELAVDDRQANVLGSRAHGIADGDATIVGVVLFATGEGGGLSNNVIWLASQRTGQVVERWAIPGRLDRSTIRTQIHNLAAAVAWMSWRTPDHFEMPDPESKEWAKFIKTAKFQKALRNGATSSVQIVDLPARSSSGQSASNGGPSKSSHLRAGHWRRSRVGPRDSWEYAFRWIPPVVVNPGGREGGGVRVYRLPTRERMAA